MQFYGLKSESFDLILDRKKIEMALDKSPTGGNAKPFSWRWMGNHLLISYDAGLAEHYLNRNHQASWLALGCLIESARVAAQAQGWEMDYGLIDGVIGTLMIFKPGLLQNQPSQTAPIWLTRKTYRGRFEPSPVPKVLPDLAKAGTQVHLTASSSLTDRFCRYILKSDTYLWLQTKATASFLKEVRFFDSRIEPRGIRAADLGIGIGEQFMFY